jgi:hypothetical protein
MWLATAVARPTRRALKPGGVVRRAASNEEDLLTVLGKLRFLCPQGTQRRQSCRDGGRLLGDLLSHDRLHALLLW